MINEVMLFLSLLIVGSSRKKHKLNHALNLQHNDSLKPRWSLLSTWQKMFIFCSLNPSQQSDFGWSDTSH